MPDPSSYSFFILKTSNKTVFLSSSFISSRTSKCVTYGSTKFLGFNQSTGTRHWEFDDIILLWRSFFRLFALFSFSREFFFSFNGWFEGCFELIEILFIFGIKIDGLFLEYFLVDEGVRPVFRVLFLLGSLFDIEWKTALFFFNVEPLLKITFFNLKFDFTEFIWKLYLNRTIFLDSEHDIIFVVAFGVINDGFQFQLVRPGFLFGGRRRILCYDWLRW